MKKFIFNHARLIAFFNLVLYILMMGSGLALETIAGSYFAGTELFSVVVEVSVMTIWIAVGVLLVSRYPGHPVGWIWLMIPIIVALDHFTWGYAYYGLFTNPGSLPGVELMIVWNYWNGRTLGIIPLTLLFLLFPTGQPLSRRWGWLAWIAFGTVAVHIPLAAIAPIPISFLPFPLDILGASESLKAFLAPFFWITGIVPVLCALMASLSLMIRLYRSRGVERQQIKWFVYVAAIFIPGTFLIISSGIQQILPQSLLFNLGVGVTLISITGMAVASAIAILRYRLWDIDLIIRRTLVYGVFTTTLVVVYVGLVIMLGGILRALVGSSGRIATIISTLTTAALFTPMRHRIQDVIDRRFYRQKYDAQHALAEFAATARGETDLEALTTQVVAIVQETIQPEQVSLWLRVGDEGQRRANDLSAPTSRSAV